MNQVMGEKQNISLKMENDTVQKVEILCPTVRRE